jgi:saccharopepsin
LLQAGYSVEEHVQALSQKYLGSHRPESRADVIFNTNPPKSDGLHPVPVTNFMNAQCKPSNISVICTSIR